MTQLVAVTVTPLHVRAALQSAAGKGLQMPSVEFEEHVAKYLDGCKFWTTWTAEEPCSMLP